jgi:hypothetical protein
MVAAMTIRGRRHDRRQGGEAGEADKSRQHETGEHSSCEGSHEEFSIW